MVKRVQSSKQNLETSAPVTWEIEMEEKKDKAKKQRRSSKRVKQPAMKHGLPLLRASSVKPVTLERYQLHHNNFQVWRRESFRRTQTVKELDCSLVDYLQEKYYAGEDLAYANYTLAAVAFFRPGMKGATTLPLTHQCMRGWRNLCPARSRMPLPYEVVTLLAVTAVKKGLTQVGLVLMLNFYLYLRPSEFSRLRVCDLVRPAKRAGKTYRWWGVLLNPSEEGIPSKTLQWDEALVLDLPYQQFLGPAMDLHLQLRNRAKGEKAFTVTVTDINQFLQSEWIPLGLQPLGAPHLYRLRHGGASHEMASQLRCLSAVQLRGRWQALKSVKNYEKEVDSVSCSECWTKGCRKDVYKQKRT